jgi:hypothetical protein
MKLPEFSEKGNFVPALKTRDMLFIFLPDHERDNAFLFCDSSFHGRLKQQFF